VETILAILAVSAGFVIRLAIPISVTCILVYFLRKLDARWQRETQNELPATQKPECWKIKNCSAEQRKECIAYSSSLPCWQVFRLPNGYLREECLSCKVFRDAPIPSFKVDPRRM